MPFRYDHPWWPLDENYVAADIAQDGQYVVEVTVGTPPDPPATVDPTDPPPHPSAPPPVPPTEPVCPENWNTDVFIGLDYVGGIDTGWSDHRFFDQGGVDYDCIIDFGFGLHVTQHLETVGPFDVSWNIPIGDMIAEGFATWPEAEYFAIGRNAQGGTSSGYIGCPGATVHSHVDTETTDGGAHVNEVYWGDGCDLYQRREWRAYQGISFYVQDPYPIDYDDTFADVSWVLSEVIRPPELGILDFPGMDPYFLANSRLRTIWGKTENAGTHYFAGSTFTSRWWGMSATFDIYDYWYVSFYNDGGAPVANLMCVL